LDAIKSKDALHHRGFVSEEVYQLKKLVGEFFIKKVSLLIKNVLVMLFRWTFRYSMGVTVRCTPWGVSLEK
jgi:hypothetical protein